MKRGLSFTLTLAFLLFICNVDAQKTVIHKGKGEKKTVVHKGKRGQTTVVHKKKQGKVRAHKRPVRVKRTREVHYHYSHLPRRGSVVTTLHRSALTFTFGGVGYRFHSGVWYKPQGPKWMVVRPPIGLRIKVLPVGYRKVFIGSNIYYYYYGTYYVQNYNEYEVIEAPMGAEIGSLPDGYNTIEIAGDEYYELDQVYYLPSRNP